MTERLFSKRSRAKKKTFSIHHIRHLTKINLSKEHISGLVQVRHLKKKINILHDRLFEIK